MWKLKLPEGKDRWVFLLTVGVILCILAFPAGSKSSRMALPASRNVEEAGSASMAAGQDAAAYERELEKRVKEILRGVSGVGEVDVMIVLKSSAEKVIQVDNSTSKSVTTEKGSGTDRAVESLEQEHSTVLTGSGSGQEPVVAKEVYPEIAGIVISAYGGGNPSVQAEISEAMEALFGLPANKIKVLKRVE